MASRRLSPRWETIIAVVFVIVWIVVANLTLDAFVDPKGEHARGHFGSAQSALPHLGVLAVMFWALPRRRAWVRGLLGIAALVVLVGCGITLAGNLKVIDAASAQGWTEAEAEAVEETLPGVQEGHDQTSSGMWTVVWGAVAFAAILMATKALGLAAGISSIVLSVIFPPWIAPGFGLVVVAIALLRERERRERSQPVGAVHAT
ncbi:MAG: hypothetical protein ABR529_05860 [Actinomycetota bacterium]